MDRVIPRPPLPPGPFVVAGLARSGVAAALALKERNEEVIGCDSGAVPDEAVQRLTAAGVEVRTGAAGAEFPSGARTVVKSPGVPKEAALIQTAREHGVNVLGEVEVGWRLIPNEFVAVTGTNGKTTTTELVGHIHREAGLPVVVAGNVGTALTSLPGTIAPGATVVCEVSSFQLEDMVAFAPEAAVLVNLTPDHLDRHKTFEAYRNAKLEVFARQPNEAVAVAPLGLGIEDLGGCARRVCFGGGPEAELAHRAGRLWWNDMPLLETSEIRLRGAHNVENAMAAAAVTLARGVDPEAVCAGLRSFAGLAHRLEEVAEAGGVLYVNDSKATNVVSAVVGIRSFPGGVHVILGGRSKGGGFDELVEPVAEHCRAAYLIGETAAELREALAPAGVPLHDCGDLEHAVAAASRNAREGDVVLLSPACPSFDQYTSYEERGDHFRELARAAATTA
jgi:UDP-N-acetylmuramoylalanine--D-glutamate ligase